jgi:hypothetical protein
MRQVRGQLLYTCPLPQYIIKLQIEPCVRAAFVLEPQYFGPPFCSPLVHVRKLLERGEDTGIIGDRWRTCRAYYPEAMVWESSFPIYAEWYSGEGSVLTQHETAVSANTKNC